jgi:hypothetical protein
MLAQMRRRFCGRQPLCGTGVTSAIMLMRMPSAASARTEDSRPGPGPLISTSRFLMPCSTCSTAGHFGCDLGGKRRGLARTLETLATRRRPRQGIALAVGDRDDGVVERSMHVRDAVRTFLRTFLRTRCAALLAGLLPWWSLNPDYFFSDCAALRGPLRVRALVRVRWPRIGRPRRWRKPR